MTMRWVGVRRLALLLGGAGALIGLAWSIAVFSEVQKEIADYDRFAAAWETGNILVSDSGGDHLVWWWKDRVPSTGKITD